MARKDHSGNGHDPRHATETPDVSHIKNPDVTHEASDVSVVGVLTFVGGLTLMTVAVFLLMLGLFRFFNAQEAEKEPDPGPMAMSPEERLPPDPKLQAAPGFGVKLESGEIIELENREPEAEYVVIREQWERQLNCSSGDHESAPRPGCVPIHDAMEKLFEGEGLPVRAQEPSQASSISLPTAASSGRMTEKGN